MKRILVLAAILLWAGTAWAGPQVTGGGTDLSSPGDIGDETPGAANFTDVEIDYTSSAVTGGSDKKAIDLEAIHDAVVTGTSQDLYGSRFYVQKTGADTSPDSYTTYGQSITATNTGSTNAGTKYTYGVYSAAIGDAAGTSTTYGLYTSASGSDTNYGLYSASGTGVFVLNAAEQVYINATSTPQTQTEGALEIDVTTATDGVFAVNIDLSNTKTTGTGTTALYVGARSSAIVTSGNQSLYGAEIYSTKSGADTNADATNIRGVNVQAQNTGSTNVGTRSTMGGYFSATGDAAGTSTAYGIYATATGADTNWAGYFDGAIYATGLSGAAITDSTATTSSTVAASATGVKAAYDLANGKQTTHANLTALSGLTGAASKMFYFTGAGTLALIDAPTAQGQMLVSGASPYAPVWSSTASWDTVNLPSSNSDPGTTAGQIKHDSTDTGSNSGGTAKWYDGANVRSLVDTGTNYTIITKTEYLPIRYAEDGTTGPAAAAEISTTTAIGRGFDKDADEDVVFWWVAPNDYVGGIKYRVIYALGADATADDTAVFSLAGCAAANSATLGCTPGDPVTLADELTTDDDQYQVMISDYSTEVTVTDIAAGSLNRLAFLRDVSEDDYTEGDLLVIGIEIKYKAKIIGFGGY